jgi:hypothetical protein
VWEIEKQLPKAFVRGLLFVKRTQTKWPDMDRLVDGKRRNGRTKYQEEASELIEKALSDA